jgi:hypothetical protein
LHFLPQLQISAASFASDYTCLLSYTHASKAAWSSTSISKASSLRFTGCRACKRFAEARRADGGLCALSLPISSKSCSYASRLCTVFDNTSPGHSIESFGQFSSGGINHSSGDCSGYLSFQPLETDCLGSWLFQDSSSLQAHLPSHLITSGIFSPPTGNHSLHPSALSSSPTKLHSSNRGPQFQTLNDFPLSSERSDWNNTTFASENVSPYSLEPSPLWLVAPDQSSPYSPIFADSLDFLGQPPTDSGSLVSEADFHCQLPEISDLLPLVAASAKFATETTRASFHIAALRLNIPEADWSSHSDPLSAPSNGSQAFRIPEERDTASSSKSASWTPASLIPEVVDTIGCIWPSCGKTFPNRTQYL